ncbi:beta-N-acetylhexosaminidase [Caenorhabditis elegans]|nr:beta-N-acetylhexosaminidase [Caenorhabditis elegans]CAA22078.3 beta-N-acetylhexosaminidase [Caenorhabditis elegans]
MLLRRTICILACIVQFATCGYQRSIVHFDMKGAPPKVAYFKQLLTTISGLGATGVLLEWEDMFPYQGGLSRVVNKNAYTEEEVISVLEHAQQLQLEVIPLVQTLAHMEWILKTEEYSVLREDERYPMVACIGNPESLDIILDSVNQLMRIHSNFNTGYVHIGADEAFQVGICDADREILPVKYDNNKLRMIFDHLRMVSLNITEEYPSTKVLMWYDELKSAPLELIKEYNLDNLVIPVVWKYTANLDNDLPSEMWKNMSYSFKEVWGGSAFKGADGASRYWNRLKPYILNNKEWYLQNEKYKPQFTTFDSIIITGWQRYDHFASLCELWPTSMVSLALNLIVLTKFHIDKESAEQVIQALNCPQTTTLDQLVAGSDRCRFPGYRVRDSIRDYVQLKTFFENSTWVHNRENGWLQSSHMRISASNPYYIDAIGKAYERTLKKLDTVSNSLSTSFSEVFYPDVIEEFKTDYFQPFYEDLQKRKESVDNIDTKRFYVPRPWFRR